MPNAEFIHLFPNPLLPFFHLFPSPCTLYPVPYDIIRAMAQYTIKDLPEHERPRERLEAHGAAAVSNAELLAVILRVGIHGQSAVELANVLLVQFGSLEKLATADFATIAAVKGIGKAKACQIAAAFELGRRSATHRDGRRPVINAPNDLVPLLKPQLDALDQETFNVALLNTKNELLRIVPVSQGTLSGSLVHPRETFRAAIVEGCYSVILVHNHPSGDPEPSQEDISVTRNLADAGRIIGIRVLDHIIIAKNGFRSLKDLGVIS
jgi:DNA repair protein RadC